MIQTTSLHALILALAVAVPPVFADPIYKCTGADGKITYSQNPCYGESWQRFGAPKESSHKAQAANAKTVPAAEADKAVRKPSSQKPTESGS